MLDASQLYVRTGGGYSYPPLLLTKAGQNQEFLDFSCKIFGFPLPLPLAADSYTPMLPAPEGNFYSQGANHPSLPFLSFSPSSFRFVR